MISIWIGKINQAKELVGDFVESNNNTQITVTFETESGIQLKCKKEAGKQYLTILKNVEANLLKEELVPIKTIFYINLGKR